MGLGSFLRRGAPAPADRDPAPSRATVAGSALGGPVAAAIMWALGLAGVTLSPEVAAALGTLIGAAIAYATAGGRKGESV